MDVSVSSTGNKIRTRILIKTGNKDFDSKGHDREGQGFSFKPALSERSESKGATAAGRNAALAAEVLKINQTVISTCGKRGDHPASGPSLLGYNIWCFPVDRYNKRE